jgi:squalene-hopene/tetraprenyl-beta-curcumene cyclase
MSTDQMRMPMVVVVASLVVLSAGTRAAVEDSPSWNPKQAAAYLDGRAEWWSTWPNAARDHETFCVSCHTAAPYAIGRPALRSLLKETGPSAPERRLHDNVAKRVKLWTEVAPFYPDQTRGIPKTSESRGTESVLNALVLSTRDAESGTLSNEARSAFGNMWALQMLTGDLKGGWAWLNFHYEPWEAPASPYFGASLAAIAVGTAPGGYAASPEAKDGIARLREYLGKGAAGQSLFNQLMITWASSRLEGVLTPAQRETIAKAALSAQLADGAWNVQSLGAWKRVDNTPLDTKADGLATALAVLALQQSGVAGAADGVERGLAWLRSNQDRATGRWIGSSLNKNRDPNSDPGRFMSDAATAYAVLALTNDTKTSTSRQ